MKTFSPRYDQANGLILKYRKLYKSSETYCHKVVWVVFTLYYNILSTKSYFLVYLTVIF